MARDVGSLALAATFFCALFASPIAHAADVAFSFEALRVRAQEMSRRPYVAPPSAVPEWLRKLNYDEYRIIEFNADQSLWRREKLPFQAQFFHPGNLFERVVRLHEVRDGRAESIRFQPELFNYRSLKTGPLPDTLGFAGVRFLYPLNHGGDELGAFLGASYFRFLCERAAYGLSARGLAIDTAEPSGEEFPVFSEFWLERPTADAKELVVHALLDSPGVAGAYRFAITPGAETIMQVKAALFLRKTPRVLGLAPLTSMYWRGENSGAPTEKDPRPEVHDSDGLLVQMASGEHIWRPLTNPRVVRVSAFSAESPRAFGLLQRDRDFEHYRDREAHYDRRPSAWIAPLGNWGAGEVRLVEIPTANEYNDNIVAFWSPAKLPAPGEPLEFGYRLHWFLDPIGASGGFAAATRHETVAGESNVERFTIEFANAKVPASAPGNPVPDVTVGMGAQLVRASLAKGTGENTWRAIVDIRSDGSGRPVELRCFLRSGPLAFTETWSYLWQP